MFSPLCFLSSIKITSVARNRSVVLTDSSYGRSRVPHFSRSLREVGILSASRRTTRKCKRRDQVAPSKASPRMPLLDHPRPRQLRLHRNPLLHAQTLQRLVQHSLLDLLPNRIPTLGQNRRHHRRQRLPHHPRRLRLQIRVRLLQFGHALLQLPRRLPALRLDRRPLVHRRHDPVDFHVQCFLLPIQPPQHAIQRFGRIRQPFRRRHQLLHHLFIHIVPSPWFDQRIAGCPILTSRILRR